MKRYFLITVGIGIRDIEVPFSTKDGKFISRKEMLEYLMQYVVCKDTTPIIKMIYEFQSYKDYLDFTN